ncbi:MAG TPA: aldo/keto reductase family protein [Phycisphaerae bacterium]|nr:aldo/keto reductase family protein [Phycisphaerae bacterium]HNU45457.1 aldo/keto reductase family protein [Phycisphaerae bacterium]
MMAKAEMTCRPLGRCGTQVSVFGLGGWTTFGDSVTDAATVRRTLAAAFSAGINFFDIADAYARGEAERAMGRVLGEFPRHELVISSKVFFPMSDDVNDRGLSRKHIMESIDKTLMRIGTDYLDLYFCHRFDPNTPVEETARAMDDLVRQGKILYWGTSEWTGTQLRDAHALCDRRQLYAPQVEQPQYSLLVRHKFEHDVRPAAGELGMGLVTWSPLGMGILTGKYDEGLPKGSRLARVKWLHDWMYQETSLARTRRFQAPAQKLGCTRAQLALAWTVSQPGVTSVILGVTNPEQLEENLAALAVEIPKAMRKELDKIFPCEPEPPAH